MDSATTIIEPSDVQVPGFARPHQITADTADVQVVNFDAHGIFDAMDGATKLLGLNRTGADRPVRGVEVQEYRTRDGRWNFRAVICWDRRAEVRR